MRYRDIAAVRTRIIMLHTRGWDNSRIAIGVQFSRNFVETTLKQNGLTPHRAPEREQREHSDTMWDKSGYERAMAAWKRQNKGATETLRANGAAS